MKKKLTAAIILTCLILSLFSANALAETYGDFSYTVSDGEAKITGFSSSAAAVSIPGKIYDYPVTSIASKAFYGCSSLTYVTIPDSVEIINFCAFADCENLNSVILPRNLKVIDELAFYNCTSLKSITIPEGTTTIRDDAFSGCSKLTSVTLPESLTSIGERAFYWCNSLENITIPSGVTSIPERAFYRCELLTNITLSNSMKNIGHMAFDNCDSIWAVYFYGTEEEWNDITIEEYNEMLTVAQIVYLDKECNISYNGNGGYCFPLSQAKNYGETVFLTDEIPSRRGYNFIEWNTKDDGTGAAYAPGDEYSEDADLALYAIWEMKAQTRTKKVNGIYMVEPLKIPAGSYIMFVCYSDGMLAYTDEFYYKKEAVVPFYTDKDCDTIKVFVWDEKMSPITEPEWLK